MKNFRLQRLSSNQIALITSDYDAMRIPKHQMALITSGNQVKMKNFWRKPGQSTDYMGINAIYRTQDGFPFEVQYHTPEVCLPPHATWTGIEQGLCAVCCVLTVLGCPMSAVRLPCCTLRSALCAYGAVLCRCYAALASVVLLVHVLSTVLEK